MFEINLLDEPGRQTLAPVGELDIATRERLEQVLTPLLDAEDKHVVVDLRGVEFMDASAAGLLVTCADRARAGKVRFSLILGPRSSYRVLELCGLLELFEVLPGRGGSPA
jgi:anti-sigma B factor antagonist